MKFNLAHFLQVAIVLSVVLCHPFADSRNVGKPNRKNVRPPFTDGRNFGKTNRNNVRPPFTDGRNFGKTNNKNVKPPFTDGRNFGKTNNKNVKPPITDGRNFGKTNRKNVKPPFADGRNFGKTNRKNVTPKNVNSKNVIPKNEIRKNGKGKPTQQPRTKPRINIGGREENIILPFMAQMYINNNYGDDLTFRCQGVIISADIILTTKECGHPDDDCSGFCSFAKWDVTKWQTVKTKPDNGMLYTLQVFRANVSESLFQRTPDGKAVDWDLFESENDSGELRAYELKKRMDLDSQWVTEASLTGPHESSGSFSECRLYSWGGNGKLNSVRVNDEKTTTCHEQGADVKHRVCMRAENDYNLCKTDGGGAVICTREQGGIKLRGERQELILYGMVGGLKHEQNCNIKYNAQTDLISVIKVGHYITYLRDLIWFKYSDHVSGRRKKEIAEVNNPSFDGTISQFPYRVPTIKSDLFDPAEEHADQ